MTPAKRHIVIAGGGIAGLSAALALEHFGFAATVFERSPKSEAVGAGVQLSPNATRLLGRLHVLPRLDATAIAPKSVLLCDGATTLPLLSLNVSDSQNRWGAPYLVAHRADLHAALLAQAASRPAIRIKAGHEVSHFAAHANGVTVSLTSNNVVTEDEGMLLIGADGVWSRIRARLGGPRPMFSQYVAQRKMFEVGDVPAALRRLASERQVAAFLSPDAHIVAYPVSGARQLNLVSVTRAASTDHAIRVENYRRFDPEFAALFAIQDGWLSYPIHKLSVNERWSDGKTVVLIGDAAHAMEPYAAQGAAMAIEDAWVLASCLAHHRTNLSAAIAAYDSIRRPRIARVSRRNRLNRFAYHASGPTAWARDLLFRYRSDDFRSGLDWLYSWDFKMK